MGSNYVTNPVEFLINTLFGLYILAVMLRFLLAAVRADFYNPISQFLVKITNPPLLPLRRILPSVGKLDTSSLVLMLALQMASFALIGLLRGGSLSLGALLILSCAELIGLFLNVLLFSILVQVIISWVNPGTYNPAVSLLYSLTEPVLRPCRRLVPPMSGMDLSPLIALIAIQLIKMLLLPPYIHWRTKRRFMYNECYAWQGAALLLNIRVQARASHDEITGVVGGQLKIRLTAPPVDGKANQALLKFLAQCFGVPRAQVTLLSGDTGRSKRVRIDKPRHLPHGIRQPGL